MKSATIKLMLWLLFGANIAHTQTRNNTTLTVMPVDSKGMEYNNRKIPLLPDEDHSYTGGYCRVNNMDSRITKSIVLQELPVAFIPAQRTAEAFHDLLQSASSPLSRHSHP